MARKLYRPNKLRKHQALAQEEQRSGGKKTIGLFDLPPELRNLIYALVLEAPGHVNFYFPIDTDPNSQPRIRLYQRNAVHPNILRTCKRINGEATSILYGDNTFAGVHVCFTRFLEIIRPRVTQLRHVRTSTEISDVRFYSFLKPLEKASALEKLEIHIRYYGGEDGNMESFVLLLSDWVQAQRRLQKTGSRTQDALEVLQLCAGDFYSPARLAYNGAEELVAMVRERVEKKLLEISAN